MSEYTPTTEQIRAWFCDPTPWANPDRAGIDFDAWLAAHDAEVRAEYESDPAKDERFVRYMAMATPLGYQSALTVVQQMTALIEAETRARAAGVVTEEPEWEYGIRAEGDDEPYTDHSDDPDWLCDQITPEPGDAIVRRRKAGPWVPVKQEGAETDA